MFQRLSALFGALLSIVLLAGCVSYDYEGESAPATAKDALKMYTDARQIKSAYRELGTATVSGNYQNVSRERMIDKLKSEAAENGADAVLIVEQQVEPVAEEASSSGTYRTAIDADTTSASWNQIQSDVDQNYGNIRKDPTPATTVYRRVIRAKFIRFDKEK